jgi:hypothetical protein
MNIHNIVRQLRQFRSIHRYIGVCIAVLVMISAFTGILLGWKKDSETLQPTTRKGTTTDLEKWQSFQAISESALHAMDSLGIHDNTIDRFDVRPDKGIVKVLFSNGYWEVQVDGASGKALSVAQRHSDWIEHLHDGSIVSDFFKLIYTNILGVGLLVLSVTGVYLWYAPKIVRRSKRRK